MASGVGLRVEWRTRLRGPPFAHRKGVAQSDGFNTSRSFRPSHRMAIAGRLRNGRRGACKARNLPFVRRSVIGQFRPRFAVRRLKRRSWKRTFSAAETSAAPRTLQSSISQSSRPRSRHRDLRPPQSSVHGMHFAGAAHDPTGVGTHCSRHCITPWFDEQCSSRLCRVG